MTANRIVIDPSRPQSVTPPIDRFLDKLVIEAKGCWTLDAHVDASGYSSFWWRDAGRRQSSGHRFAYTYFVGQIPDGLVLDHLCRNRACVNPSHLEAVTQRVNVRRGIAPPAVNAAKIHCDYGHPLEEAFVRPDGSRDCIPCRSRRARAKNTGVHPLRDRTHCSHGHEFTAENTHRTADGARKCRRCHADQERARRAARKAA